MTFAYFDCPNGISGDMVLGAFVDLGVDPAELDRRLKSMPLKAFSLDTQPIKRCGIQATKVNVISEEKDAPHRHLKDIEKLIQAGDFSDRIKERSLRAFLTLADAEATVHDSTPEKVHFHEVGALDAIVDIVGAMVAAEMLGIDQAAASVVTVGSGMVNCAHGQMPIPAPATALILKDIPIQSGEIAAEMTTPTGAVILRTLCSEFGAMPPAQFKRIGYGAGSREFPKYPNLLRVLLGERKDAPEDDFVNALHSRRLETVVTEIDDMSAELYSSLMERLFAAGALDVQFVPLHMKKNRPAIRVEALCDPANTAAILRLLLEETTTFGARIISAERYCLPREMHRVDTPWGAVQAKCGLIDGRILKASPEYEDCRRLAEENNVPVRRVLTAAIRAIEERWFS